MFVQRPMRIGWKSPRTTLANQTLESLPMTTSPATHAVGAMKTDGSTFGRLPLYGTMSPIKIASMMNLLLSYLISYCLL